MLAKKEITTRLETIYNQIPDCKCKHCHECCGPIVWFEPEEVLIRDYLIKHKMKYLVLTTDEFQQQNMKCPYIKNDRCSIYPVRPIVCRLQGNIPELPCKQQKNRFLSKQKRDKVRQEMDILIREINGIGLVHSTRKFVENEKKEG